MTAAQTIVEIMFPHELTIDMPVPIPFPTRFSDAETITAADIEAWAKVERALAGKRDACHKLRQGHAAAR